MDLRVGLERLKSVLHNYDAHHREGHEDRFLAAMKRLDKVRQIANDPSVTDNIRFSRCFSYLRKVEPLVFEELILMAFKRAGFAVRFNKTYSGDGGIDGQVWIKDWRSYDPYFARQFPDTRLSGWAGIQCKRYEGAVSREHIRQYPHDLQSANLVAGFFVHTGTTPKQRKPMTTEERQARKGLPPVRILSGSALFHFLAKEEFPMDTILVGQPQVSARE